MTAADVVYITGPMTGKRDLNRQAFADAEAFVRTQWIGAVEVINPARHPDLPVWADNLKRDLALIAQRVTVVAALSGWQDSRGSRLEVVMANALGIPVYSATTGVQINTFDISRMSAVPRDFYGPRVEDPPALPEAPVPDGGLVRQFDTGATRNNDEEELDYEGFLSPLALEAFARYMHGHRRQADGKLRDRDNWQKGIPPESYLKSMVRHMLDVWRLQRGYPSRAATLEEALSALLFNVQGLLHETLKAKA